MPKRALFAGIFAVGFAGTRVAVGDLNQDGKLEIVLTEGERDPAKLAWISQPYWVPNVLRRDLFHPHSLAVADFNGNGLPDIFVGEMGLAKDPNPRLIVYLNLGEGRFEEHHPIQSVRASGIGDWQPQKKKSLA